MSRVRSSQENAGVGDEESRRLPLRWAVILLVAGLAGIVAYSGGGPVEAVIVFFTVTGTMHVMLS